MLESVRRWIKAVLLAAAPWLISHAAVAAALPEGGRVMSINLCTDALVLDLLPPERIVSVSFLSRFSSDPGLAAKAARVGVNYGLAEEVAAQNPALVLAGIFSATATRQALKRVGYPIVE